MLTTPLINEINGLDLLYTLTSYVKRGGKRTMLKMLGAVSACTGATWRALLAFVDKAWILLTYVSISFCLLVYKIDI